MDSKQKNKDRKLLHFFQKIDRAQNKNKSLIYPFIPEKLKDVIVDAYYYQGILTILINNPAIMTQLRFVIPQLQKKLKTHSEFQQLKIINISLFDQKTAIKKKPSESYIPDKKVTQSLTTLSENLEDGKLKDAVLELKKTIDKKNQS